jgi:hypothetical protein
MRLIGLIKHPIPGDPGGPLAEGKAFYAALRDEFRGKPASADKLGTISILSDFAGRETIERTSLSSKLQMPGLIEQGAFVLYGQGCPHDSK